MGRNIDRILDWFSFEVFLKMVWTIMKNWIWVNPVFQTVIAKYFIYAHCLAMLQLLGFLDPLLIDLKWHIIFSSLFSLVLILAHCVLDFFFFFPIKGLMHNVWQLPQLENSAAYHSHSWIISQQNHFLMRTISAVQSFWSSS